MNRLELRAYRERIAAQYAAAGITGLHVCGTLSVSDDFELSVSDDFCLHVDPIAPSADRVPR